MADDETFQKALQLDVRDKIYHIIASSPGLHFREIQRRAGLAVGSLQYHLDYLHKHHIIRTQKEGKFVRYYTVRDHGMEEGESSRKTMAFLRHASTRKIMLYLLNEKRANNETIAAQIGLSPSTTSWHLDKLVKEGILVRSREGRKTFFSLVDPKLAQKLVVDFKQSFLDDAVDNFVEIVETLAEPIDHPGSN